MHVACRMEGVDTAAVSPIRGGSGVLTEEGDRNVVVSPEGG